MSQKSVLGKGLASLFPGTAAPSGQASAGAGATVAGTATTVEQKEFLNRDRHPGISIADVNDILVNPHQPRREFGAHALEELAQSIRENGIIQPLIVRKTTAGKYELIAGERRLRASKIAGLKQVPIVIRKSTDRESLELALIENIQRQDLNCIDEALAYFQLVEDFALTQEEVAKRVGKDRASVANHLRLLRLPQDLIEDLRSQKLSLGHGKALCALENNELRVRARNEIFERHLSVRDTEALVEALKTETTQAKISKTERLTSVTARIQSLAQDLTRQYSARVEIKGGEKRGKLIFHYSSREELDRLIEAMQK